MGSKQGVEGLYGRKVVCARPEVERERSVDAGACKAYVGWEEKFEFHSKGIEKP